MSKKISPYETVATRGFVIDKVTSELNKYLALSDKEAISTDFENVLRVIPSEIPGIAATPVPAFAHPIKVTNEDYFVDVRPFTKVNMSKVELTVTNPIEYFFNTVRAKLCSLWDSERSDYFFRDTSALPMNIYSSWVSENVARRFSLDHATQYKLMILSALFYQSLFVSNEEWNNEEHRSATVLRIVRDLRVDSNDVFALLEEMKELPFENIDDFCKLASTILGTVRLEKLNTALLFTILGNTWMGFNAREVACVSLEHIPTFFTMVYGSIVERGLMYSAFSKLVKRKASKNDSFETKLTSLIKTFNHE